MDKITEIQKFIMDQRLSNDQVSIILENTNRSFNRALNGIKIDMPEIIKKMNQLSYEDLLSVQTLIFLEGQENSRLRKKREGTLKLISKEIEDIDYECSQCNVEVKDHLTIANKSQEELLELDNKIGGSISWRLYDKISNNEALQTYQEENNKKDEIEHVTIGEYDDVNDNSELQKVTNALIAMCKSDVYKDIFGNLIISDPLSITLNETALNLAQKSDNSLEKIIDRCTDGEKDSLVKYEKLELRLRKQFYEIYQGESVKGILFRCIKDRHSLNRFGRGRVIVWPLEVVYRLHQKEKEFSQNKKEEVKEIPDNDMVNKPKHYMFNVDGHDVQAIDLVKGLLTPEEFRGWIKGSYFTYLMRADRKNGIEDLEKARTFLNWQIQLDKGEELTLPGKK
jgi:hypothetical protein|nr:MAG TPA: nucelotide kinase [Caudoviricetes sp.]